MLQRFGDSAIPMLQRFGVSMLQSNQPLISRNRVAPITMFGIQTLIMMTTMMTAMPEAVLDTVKEASRKLRAEGAYREAVNHKIAQVKMWVSTDLMHNPIVTPSHWIRDSLAQQASKAISWVAEMRPQDYAGNWLPKGSWWGHTHALRDRENSTYEPRLKVFGFTAIPTRKGTYAGWNCAESMLRLRKGMLRNGNNAKVWAYSVSRREWELMRAYSRMEQTPSVLEAIEKANRQGAQKWQEVVFFNALSKDGTTVFTAFADRAFKDALEAQGVKTRNTPFIAEVA